MAEDNTGCSIMDDELFETLCDSLEEAIEIANGDKKPSAVYVISNGENGVDAIDSVS